MIGEIRGAAELVWALGLRGIAGLALAICILALPSATLASLVLLFGRYVVGPEKGWEAQFSRDSQMS
jgi:hypothetical protein